MYSGYFYNDDYFLINFLRSFTFLPTSSLTMVSTDFSVFVSSFGEAVSFFGEAELLDLLEAEPDLNPGINEFTWLLGVYRIHIVYAPLK